MRYFLVNRKDQAVLLLGSFGPAGPPPLWKEHPSVVSWVEAFGPADLVVVANTSGPGAYPWSTGSGASQEGWRFMTINPDNVDSRWHLWPDMGMKLLAMMGE